MSKVVLTPRALKDLDHLEKEVKQRIGRKLKQYAENPLYYAYKLSNPRIGSYRFSVGEYRIIFDLDGDALVVLRIGHRKHIYR